MHQALSTTILLVFSFILLSSSVQKQPVTPAACISAEEQKLYTLIMEYRKKNNLPTIPLSKSLTYVAQQHCKDLVINKPAQGKCNAHSWSSKGKWTGCCYTPDHKQARCMWDKPKEITSYQDNGFEIAAQISGPGEMGMMTAEGALKLWQGSVHHNDVILNKSIWKDNKWGAIGVGIYNGYSTVWFGNSVDTEPTPVLCK